jgi:hypothetical protein
MHIFLLLIGNFQQEQADLEGQKGREEEDVRLSQPQFSFISH